MGYIFKKVAAYGQFVLVLLSPSSHSHRPPAPHGHSILHNIYPCISYKYNMKYLYITA